MVYCMIHQKNPFIICLFVFNGNAMPSSVAIFMARKMYNKSSHPYLYSAFNNTDCVIAALHSIKQEHSVSMQKDNTKQLILGF